MSKFAGGFHSLLGHYSCFQRMISSMMSNPQEAVETTSPINDDITQIVVKLSAESSWVHSRFSSRRFRMLYEVHTTAELWLWKHARSFCSVPLQRYGDEVEVVDSPNTFQ